MESRPRAWQKAGCLVKVRLAAAMLMVGVVAAAGAQAPTAGEARGTQKAAPGESERRPLQSNTLTPSGTPDPFPPTDAKNFTAQSPSVATVDAFLKQLWGYDANRIWRVEAIQTTQAPGVVRVVVYVSDKSPNAKVQTSAFFVTPDGKHAIAGDGVVSFGPTPFAETRQMLQSRADGPARGAAGKQLMLVEFADMECPHCKEVQGTMDQLVKDFPNARVVYQNFPLTEIHPFAFKAAVDGVCIAKQSPNAFWTYLQAVYDTQGGLTAESGDVTLKNAVVKAGADPGAVDLCAATPASKEQVKASMKLGEDVGVDQTPMIAVNGHLLPMTIPYETLKTIIQYQATEDGVR